MPKTCTHLDQIRFTNSPIHYCPDCVKVGSPWVHLRLCLVCGHIGCCDESPNRHARAHFRKSNHPLIRSMEPGEDWAWCFTDEVGFVLERETSA